MKALDRIAATFFGIGSIPLAPGTAASAVAALGYKGALHGLSWPLYVLLVAGLFVAGAAAAGRMAADLGHPDPGRVVIDEVCGQLVALAFLPAGWLPVGLAFALFRFFDIIKPWPIRSLENLPGGLGIMADDVGAGLAAAVVARLLLLIV
ncbi:MAG TPA: phosphatidylglycerophosphatase A [Candidatus Aminicenantes bacterium]|nr:phosphatidylglycerophosphatase A [Candidatus Aminicenantes bacterium]HDT13859.1 phosphatidylglycerophosphatase A [Candidatus Aminicenantes bacterium]